MNIIARVNTFSTVGITDSAQHWVLNAGVMIYVATGDGLQEDLTHADNNIEIGGTILSGDSAGINSAGASTSIEVDATAAIMGFTAGIWTQGANEKIVNLGSVAASGIGLRSTGESVDVANSGEIEGSTGVQVETFGGKIDNNAHGIISGATAISFISGSAQHLEIDNAGLISGSSKAFISSGNNADIIHNSGIIKGDVYLGDGRDIFSNSNGSVKGDVYGGAGSDLYIVDHHRFNIMERSANAGTDQVRSDMSYSLGKAIENLTLYGHGDINGTGNGLGNVLIGGAGNNQLFGGGGSDTISGGLGDDIMKGGSGADVFHFAVGDGKDEIQDFNENADKIDLSDVKGIVSFGDLKSNHIEYIDGSAVISYDNHDTITVDGLEKANIHRDMFIL